jgi:hypothetical protein
MATVDDIAPSYVGEDRIAVTLDPNSQTQALKPVQVNFDYSAAEPDGVVLPLELILQPAFGRGDGFQRRIFRTYRPITAVFTPIAEGDWLVVLREVGHNRWQGRLVVNVDGDPTARIDV